MSQGFSRPSSTFSCLSFGASAKAAVVGITSDKAQAMTVQTDHNVIRRFIELPPLLLIATRKMRVRVNYLGRANRREVHCW